MHAFLLLLFFIGETYGYHSQGPPPIDSGFFSDRTYYYDIHINETTRALPDLTTIMDRVEGTLYMSGNIQISQRELTKFFANLNSFSFGVLINNTNFQNLSFLRLYIVDVLDDTQTSVMIINNQNLTSTGIRFDQCTFCTKFVSIINNPKLDLTSECYNILFKFSLNRIIKGNLVDCGCTIEGTFNEYIKTMPPQCTWLVGNVTIDQNTDYHLLKEKMANVTRISGGLTIIKTNFSDLSFLSSLQRIDVDNYGFDYYRYISVPSFIISGNNNLNSLKMTPYRNGMYLTIRDNPKLCVLAQELEYMFQQYVEDTILDIDICFDENTPSYYCKVPESGALKNFPDGCKSIIGDLVLSSDYDIINSYKLYKVEAIYGSLKITNTLLRNTNMLQSLKWIISVNDNVTPLIIKNNTKLTKMTPLESLEHLESGVSVVVENNTKLEVLKRTCNSLRTRKSPVIRNNRADCDEADSEEKKDREPLNLDVFYQIPKYLDVSHLNSNGDESVTQNQPGNGNNPGLDDELDEVTTTMESVDNFTVRNALSVLFTIFILLIVPYHFCLFFSF